MISGQAAEHAKALGFETARMQTFVKRRRSEDKHCCVTSFSMTELARFSQNSEFFTILSFSPKQAKAIISQDMNVTLKSEVWNAATDTARGKDGRLWNTLIRVAERARRNGRDK